MPLTVRLPAALESSLDAHCAAQGLTRSQVVQESLASYLAARTPEAPAQPAPSRNFQAFRAAGLVGSVRAGGQSATRDAVRRAARARGRAPD